jgi:hypothetical protein
MQPKLAPYAESFPELAKKYPPLPMAALPKEPGVLKVETTAQQRIKQWRKG